MARCNVATRTCAASGRDSPVTRRVDVELLDTEDDGDVEDVSMAYVTRHVFELLGTDGVALATATTVERLAQTALAMGLVVGKTASVARIKHRKRANKDG